MSGFAGRTSISVLLLAALLGGACDAQAPTAATAAPDTTAAGIAAPLPTSDDLPSTSAGTEPTQPPEATQPPATTQPAAVGESSEAPDDADAAAPQAGDPPTSEPSSEPRDTDAGAPEGDRITNAVEISLAASFPDRALALQPGLTQGDLNDDGVDDYVAHVIEEAAGSPPTDWLVGVVDVGGAFRLEGPIELGRRITIETIDIRDGAVEVSLFDRSPFEPPTVITRRTTLSIRMDRPDAPHGADHADVPPADVTVTRVEPISSVPALQIVRPPTQAAFELDGIGTAMSDRIGLRERHPIVVHASENDVVVAALEAPAGVWLEARLDDTVLVPLAEQAQRFASRMPATGAWSITVVSSLIEPADYRLSIEVFPPGLDNRIATRDLDGFWSSTRTSPPVVPDDGPVVYLTFDDGPSPTYTPQVLDVLAKHGAQATFFVVGYLAERYPLIVQRIAHEGHTLANHSWDHRSLARISRAAFDRSVGRTQEVLGPLATPCIRPPYYDVGTYTQQWSAEHGLRLASWSYSPQDWLGPSARTIANRLVAATRGGAVLLLHDGGGRRASTVRGLDMALERLADSGFEFKALCR